MMARIASRTEKAPRFGFEVVALEAVGAALEGEVTVLAAGEDVTEEVDVEGVRADFTAACCAGVTDDDDVEGVTADFTAV